MAVSLRSRSNRNQRLARLEGDENVYGKAFFASASLPRRMNTDDTGFLKIQDRLTIILKDVWLAVMMLVVNLLRRQAHSGKGFF